MLQHWNTICMHIVVDDEEATQKQLEFTWCLTQYARAYAYSYAKTIRTHLAYYGLSANMRMLVDKQNKFTLL